MCFWCHFFFVKQKTAYELRISDWSSDVCSSDLEAAHAKRIWIAIGALALLTAGLILSYYSVIAGWSLAYMFRAASGMFGHLSADDASSVFLHLAQDPERSLSWHTLSIGRASCRERGCQCV